MEVERGEVERMVDEMSREGAIEGIKGTSVGSGVVVCIVFEAPQDWLRMAIGRLNRKN